MNCFTGEGKLSAQCIETILGAVAEGIVLLDTDGAVRYCNDSMLKMTGYSYEKMTGMNCGDLMDCSNQSPDFCHLNKEGKIDQVECRLKRSDGTSLPVLKNGRKLLDKDGTTLGIVETITNISQLKNKEARLAELEKQLDWGHGFRNIIGRSSKIREIFNLIELAANSNATILVTGETGTGKELAAQAIHDLSKRNEGPIVKVNCSALPENLLESELFGHVRGAFTGAIKDKIGRFEMADGGTLFLDEIGEVSPLIQVKLLRFLQEREFERVGESVTRKSDVRLIAATNKNLLEMVREGSFREDLYYRLKVFPIHLPALRDRKEDIGPLVEHFVRRFNKETGKELKSPDHDAAVALMDYCWPGNIRELENAIEHAFVTCPAETNIGIFDLPLEIRKTELQSQMCANANTISNSPFGAVLQSEPLTKEKLENILDRYHWNKSKVARHLGIDRTTVWRKMKQMGIELQK